MAAFSDFQTITIGQFDPAKIELTVERNTFEYGNQYMIQIQANRIGSPNEIATGQTLVDLSSLPMANIQVNGTAHTTGAPIKITYGSIG